MRPILPLRFETIQVLRETKTSSTFLATDHQLARNNVVVKAIRKGHFTPDLSAVVETCFWFRGLRHPHVSTILDAGLTPKGDLFYVRDFAQPTEMFVKKDMNLLNTFLGVVEFLHSVGRTHGSIRPSNVLATAESVQLADPWILQPFSQPTTEEDVRFTAPEVLKGQPRTIESDLYSVGALLYRFFSGRDLFDDSDLETLTSRYIWAAPRSLTSISYVSRTIADIVENLIHKDPDRRKPAFESLKDELRFEPKAATRAPAFGMDEPLEKAEQFLQAKPDRLRVLLIEGPIGFGKTRFLEELRHRMAFTQPNLVFSTCPPAGRSPYLTFAQWLLSLHDQHCSSFDDPSVKRLRNYANGVRPTTGLDKSDPLVQDFVDILGLVAQKAALVLLIEDIDRTSKPSPVLQLLLTRGGRLGVCFVLTIGSGEIRDTATYLGDANSCTLSLKPLGPSYTKVMASFLQIDPDRRAAIEQNSGGNPMFVEEYAKNRRSGVPDLVRLAISKLVAALPKETRQIAEALSLFEGPVSRDLVCQTVGISEEQLSHRLKLLERAGFYFDRKATQQSVVWSYIHSQIPQIRRIRMHASCYGHMKDMRASEPALARHAFLGGLFKEAGELNLNLARAAGRDRDHRATLHFYQLAEECLMRSSGAGLTDVEDIVPFARALGILGNPQVARARLTALLRVPEVQAKPRALASVYHALASSFVEPSATERVRLMKLGISLLPKDDSTLKGRYAVLADVLGHLGRIEEGEAAIRNADEYDIGDEHDHDGVRAMLFTYSGKFREAANLLWRVKPTALFPSMLRKANLAVCLETLGEIREARQIQMEACLEAESHRVGILSVLCLANLAAMEAKLGNIVKAEGFFHRAFTRLEVICRKELAVRESLAWYSDAALHWLVRGNYRKSADYFFRLNRTRDLGFHVEVFHLHMARCEFHLALGQVGRARRSLNESLSGGSNGGFFDVERLLVGVRLAELSRRVVEDLRSALETSRRLATKYQECRVLIALARTLSALGDCPSAWRNANEAIEMAQLNGYRVLAAEALLQRGIAGTNAADRVSDFLRCIQEAASMDLQPLFAECAFRFGAWRADCEDYSAAQNYLYKSVTTTCRIAEGLSLPDRKVFLAMSSHREAERLLQNATARSTEFFSLLREPLGKEELLLRALYRLSSALRSTRDRAGAVSVLVDSVRHCIGLPGVVLVQDGTSLKMHTMLDFAPDGMEQRAASAFKTAGSRTYIGSTWKGTPGGTAIFIPIPCAGIRAGIYVESHRGSSPLDDQDIQFLTVVSTVAGTTLQREAGPLPESSPEAHETYGIVGVSESMRKVFGDVEVATRNSATVLIEGESGTGKELVAKAVHSQGSRKNGPFVAVDCGALPESLIEAELFGARKGAFTDANADRQGLFESANQGTIFLDEIGNASPALQTKLLRVLQEREIRRVGDTKGRPIDVRLIAATNCSLDKLVEEGKFRQDLLFRLKVLHLQLPPLRRRKEDIPLLANSFLKELNRTNQTKKTFAPGVLSKLAGHEFRGNVRELQNAVERSFYACAGTLITQVMVHHNQDSEEDVGAEAEQWFHELTEGKRTFWSFVRDRYKRREIPRERVLALVDLGLKSTLGNYKAVAKMFKIEAGDYRRFMDFLRRSDCLLDFRPYRRSDQNLTRRQKVT